MLNTSTSGMEAVHYHINQDPDRRRSTTRLSLSLAHRHIPHLFAGHIPSSRIANEELDSEGDDDVHHDQVTEGSPESGSPDNGSNFLGRVQSYSKLMHAHTKAQLEIGTLPSYTKTMREHTLKQLDAHKQATGNTASHSPQLGLNGRHMMLPLKICTELTKLSLDEGVKGPSNTPEQKGHRSSSWRRS
jgi:hypothetical protein